MKKIKILVSVIIIALIFTGCSDNKTQSKLDCVFDGKLVIGAEYVNGQYTYRYKQENTIAGWGSLYTDGWGVRLTDKDSEDPVTTKLCSTINGRPIISMGRMFHSEATSLDLSSFDTSNVTDMGGMFNGSKATNLDLRNFDTSNVKSMSHMFFDSKATNLDLRNFDTSKVTDMNSMFSYSKATSINLSSFDTSNVTDMSYMFRYSEATSLDLSSFDTSNVTNMEDMFCGSKATTGYARTKEDADKFNATSHKPVGLNFVVKK